MRLAEKIVAIGKGLAESTGLDENPGIGGDADYGAQHRWRDTEPRVAPHDFVEPCPADGMTLGIPSKRVNEDVHVREDQGVRPQSSKS